MSQFGLPDSNDNVLEDRNEARRRINEHQPDSVNISSSGTGQSAFM